VHAGQRISAHDRGALERLCRYLLRPPISYERVSLTPAGQVRLRLQRAWHDGTSHLELSPHDFIARLVPLVPPPRTHRVRYHGVLSSASALRSRVIAKAQAEAINEPEQGDLFVGHLADTADRKHTPSRTPWRELIRRGFGVDPACCPKCAGLMRVIERVTQPERIAELLRHGRPHRWAWREVSPGNQPRGPPQLSLPLVYAEKAPVPLAGAA
jgi:hypothetical protein